jgi:hypothetical protein
MILGFKWLTQFQYVVVSFRLIERSSTGRYYSARAEAASVEYTSHTKSVKGTFNFGTRKEQSNGQAG